MQSFYYRRGRRSVGAIVMALLAIGAGRVWREDGTFSMLAFAVLMSLGAAKSALDATSRRPALSFNRACVRVRRTWGGVEEIPWSEVHDLSLKAYTIRYMGIIPIRRHTFITVVSEGGVFGSRRFRVSTTALGMSAAQSAMVLAALKQAQLDAVGEVGVAMAGAGTRGWGVDTAQERPNAVFDADAAMARYLAAKEKPEQTAARIVATERQPVAPLRPAFGRRVS